MAEIKLVTGGVTTVDDSMFDRFNKYLWYQCEKCRHVIRIFTKEEDGALLAGTIYMASEVLGMPGGSVCGGCNPCQVPENWIPEDWAKKNWPK